MPKVIITKPEPYCPICGARMVLRRPRPDGKQFEPFWGCNRFPDCRGTYNIGENGKPEMYIERYDPDDYGNTYNR